MINSGVVAVISVAGVCGDPCSADCTIRVTTYTC